MKEEKGEKKDGWKERREEGGKEENLGEFPLRSS